MAASQTLAERDIAEEQGEPADPANQHDDVEHWQTPNCISKLMLALAFQCVDLHQPDGDLR